MIYWSFNNGTSYIRRDIIQYSDIEVITSAYKFRIGGSPLIELCEIASDPDACNADDDIASGLCEI